MKTNSGRGRRKGAVSFVTLTLAQLNLVLKGTANVPVSRVWVEGLGLAGIPIIATTKNIGTLIPVVEETQPINVVKNQW